MKEDTYRSQFRFPYRLYEQLKESADDNHRSVNAELVARLEESFAKNSDPAVLMSAAKAREIAQAARKRVSSIVEERAISEINEVVSTGRSMAIVEFQDLHFDSMTASELRDVYGNLYDKLNAAGYHVENDGDDIMIIHLSAPGDAAAE